MEGMCPTSWSLIPLLARSPFVHGRLEMRRRQATGLVDARGVSDAEVEKQPEGESVVEE